MQLQSVRDLMVLLSEELQIDVATIQATSRFRELTNWSSLNALIILSRIHELSGVLVSPATLAKMNTVQELYDCLSD